MEDEGMPTQSRLHDHLNWAKGRIDEMDATLASLENKLGEIQADLRAKAKQVLADLRKKRDEFRNTVEAQVKADEATWADAKARIEAAWSDFEAAVARYIDEFGKQIGQRQETFNLQAAAQMRIWRDSAKMLGSAARDFAAERRGEVDAIIGRMNAEAAAAEEKLRKLNEAGNQSWSALSSALSETRAAFDRANQAAIDAFKRAAK
jgi:N-methylhydantoinase B/oxoprolinase/acetone carboxylase alpha subunit